MTPLAAELIEDLYSKIHMKPPFRQFDEYKMRSILWDCAHKCKFFECTAVTQVALHLALSMWDTFEKHNRFDQRLAFLPAEWVWLELESPGFRDQPDAQEFARVNEVVYLDRKENYTYRAAFVLIAEHGVTTMIKPRWHISYETPRKPNTPRIWRIVGLDPLPLVGSGLKPQRYTEIYNYSGDQQTFEQPTARIDDFVHYALLALINTPRIIGQRAHFPHQRLEREKLKKMKLVGKFPLRAWTEIILKVAQQDDRTGEPSEEHHLTGERCLHFCRTYLRIRLGQIEYVEGHWRGNPALGMKQSRYRVEK